MLQRIRLFFGVDRISRIGLSDLSDRSIRLIGLAALTTPRHAR
jgi:hypothetical protein